MRVQIATILLGATMIPIASLPATAQISDDTVVDLLAVQSPCGEPDRYRGKKDQLYIERDDGSILLADAYRLQALGTARSNGKLLAASCNRRFVATADSQQLHLLSTKNDRQPMTVLLPADAVGAVFTKNSRQLWVGLSGRNEVVDIDLNTGQLRTIPLPFAAARLSADFKGHNLYILDQKAGGLHVIDERSGRILSGELPKFGIGADLMRSPTDNELWIVRSDRPQISIVRTKLSIGVQTGPPIGAQKGPPFEYGTTVEERSLRCAWRREGGARP
ncbi:YncE family protein, partial [Sphingobium olei]